MSVHLSTDPLPQNAADDFARFAGETLAWRPPANRLALMGSHLYLLPDCFTDLKGLRVIHWGWWLGLSKKNRFEPSHALAMGLQVEDACQSMPLRVGHPDLLRYLRGEVLSVPGPEGWVMVAVDGFPLGWGKCVRGRLKSHLPSWLRRM